MSPPSKSIVHLRSRSFIRAGTGGALIAARKTTQGAEASDTLNLAIIGCGTQGETLARAASKVSGVPLRWVAACDLMENKATSLAARMSQQNPSTSTLSYTNVERMLEKHPEIDAVFIATPEWLHEPMTNLCLRAGKHVYCEKTMARSAAGAANMVRAQRETGKLLQIGYQRRSNPVYQTSREQLLLRLKICGRITHAYTQWNRGVTDPIMGRFSAADMQAIQAAGYEDPFQYLNWRQFRKYGAGVFADLAGHQVDVLNWFFNTPPKSVIATGGLDYYHQFRPRSQRSGLNTPPPEPLQSYEHLDNLTAVFEYDVPGNGLVRALCHVQTTNASMRSYEKFMGENATMVLSEAGDGWDEEDDKFRVYREAWDKDLAKWDREYFAKGFLKKDIFRIHHKFWERERTWPQPPQWLATDDDPGNVMVQSSQPLDEYRIPNTYYKPSHTAHVENFLKAVHTGGQQSDLHCPAEAAYITTVAVLKARELAEQGQGTKYEFKPEDFIVT